jgi:hypothetical protein
MNIHSKKRICVTETSQEQHNNLETPGCNFLQRTSDAANLLQLKQRHSNHTAAVSLPSSIPADLANNLQRIISTQRLLASIQRHIQHSNSPLQPAHTHTCVLEPWGQSDMPTVLLPQMLLHLPFVIKPS